MQAKLRVGPSDDQFEQEADRVAEQVMRMEAPVGEKADSTRATTPLVQRKVNADGAGIGTAPPIVHDVLSSPGQPLDVESRAFFEPRFGYDFNQVKVHADARAAAAVNAVNARAFTVGSDIVFGASQFAPETNEGRRLLAHELTHVVQSHGDGACFPLRRAFQQPTMTIPPEQMQRIMTRLEEFVTSSNKPTEDEKTPREVASYLVVSEDLDGDMIAALLAQLEVEAPDLMRAVTFGGRLFHAFAELGVVGMASSALWYLGVTVRDTLAGDFVEDPTTLAIILRTLLTLIPGLDTAADVEDIVANLLYGILEPSKLASIGWWFVVLIALIGLFPEIGSAIKGAVQLTVKGLGKVARVGVDAVVPRFLKLLDDGWQLPDKAGTAVRELLASADRWRPWVVTKFKDIVATIIEYLSGLPSAAAGKVARALETLRTMKNNADEMLRQAQEKLQSLLEETLEALGLRTDEIELALRDVARKVDPHEGLAIKKVLAGLGSKLEPEKLENVRRMTDTVVEAFDNPKAFAQALRTVVEQRRKLTTLDIQEEINELAEIAKKLPSLSLTKLSTTLTDEAAAYVAAVKRLAKQRGQGVVELHRASVDKVLLVRRNPAGEITETKDLVAIDGFVEDDIFMTEVIEGGEAILDFAALELESELGKGAHGAITHFLHDLVADKALVDAGYDGGAAAYRGLMGEVQKAWPKAQISDVEFNSNLYEAGTILWLGTYDRLRSLARPEHLWPPLRDILKLMEKEL